MEDGAAVKVEQARAFALVESGADLSDGPEVLPRQVSGRRAGLQVVLPGQPAQPHQLAVAVQRVPAEAQHQRRQRGSLHLGVDGDPQEQRVGRDLLQLVGRHVQPDWAGSRERVRRGLVSLKRVSLTGFVF